MKSLHAFLTVMCSLLVLALLAGVVVWLLYQYLEGARSQTNLSQEEAASSVPTHNLEYAPDERTDDSLEMTGQRSLTITTETLPPEQQNMLSRLGVEGDIVITEAEIRCLEEALGVTRLIAIVQGSVPTTFEAVKLVACIGE